MEIEDDEGEPTGEWTVLATVDGDEVTGPLAQRVRQILDQPEVLVIELGPVIPLDWGKPWLTALELSRWQPPFWEAGIERTGPVTAFWDEWDEPIGIPLPWSRYFDQEPEEGVVY